MNWLNILFFIISKCFSAVLAFIIPILPPDIVGFTVGANNYSHLHCPTLPTSSVVSNLFSFILRIDIIKAKRTKTFSLESIVFFAFWRRGNLFFYNVFFSKFLITLTFQKWSWMLTPFSSLILFMFVRYDIHFLYLTI